MRVDDNLFPQVKFEGLTTKPTPPTPLPTGGSFIYYNSATASYKKVDDSGTETTFGGGASAFTDLSDVPNSYTGQANKVVSVKSDESGLEFTTSGGGGGGGWTTLVTESGASLTNWTQETGTWTSSGTFISCVDTGTNSYLKYNNPVQNGLTDYAFDILVPSSSASNSDARIGMKFYDGVASGSKMNLYMDFNSLAGTAIKIDTTGSSTDITRTVSFTFSLDTWIPIRIINTGGCVSIYFNNVFLGTLVDAKTWDMSFFALQVYLITAQFRNIVISTSKP